jgi:hypothetical protein
VSRRSNLISLMHFRPVRQSAPFGVSPAAGVLVSALPDGPVTTKKSAGITVIPADYRWS